jgi:alkaline phosphatase D
MPVDYLDPDFEYDDSIEPPDDIRIYRDIRYGRNLHLVMTDLRLFRADHVVPEDAFPGRVVMTEEQLIESEGDVPTWADAYVDLESFADGVYVDALVAGAALLGYDEGEATGLVVVRYVNTVVEALVEAGDETWSLVEATEEMSRGLAFRTLGKTSPFSSIGSRYLAVANPYDAYARFRYSESDGASEHMLGDEQEAWFLDKMSTSDAVWKVWGNEFTLTPRRVDTSEFALPAAFQQVFLLSVEDWDGCPNKRDELLDQLSGIDNVVAVTGDIHAFFAGTPSVTGDTSRNIVEFVGAGISSTPYERLLLRTASADPVLRAAGAPALALLVQELVLEPGVNPTLAYANIKGNGFATVEVSADALDVSYFETDRANVSAEFLDSGDELAAAFETKRFRVLTGDKSLYHEQEGTYLRWDPETSSWI